MCDDCWSSVLLQLDLHFQISKVGLSASREMDPSSLWTAQVLLKVLSRWSLLHSSSRMPLGGEEWCLQDLHGHAIPTLSFQKGAPHFKGMSECRGSFHAFV